MIDSAVGEITITKADAPWVAKPWAVRLWQVLICTWVVMVWMVRPEARPGILDAVIGVASAWAVDKLAAQLTMAFLRKWALAIKLVGVRAQIYATEPTRFLLSCCCMLGFAAMLGADYAVSRIVSATPWTSWSEPEWPAGPVVCYISVLAFLQMVRYRNWYQSLPEPNHEGSK